jgi:ABC-type ATPase with predicted acetyltransferase domain
MRVMWCWRCQMDVPMLDEEEFARVAALLSEGIPATRQLRTTHGLPVEGLDMAARCALAREQYRRITGFEETNHNALLHHRISIYGAPCKSCGKPLRTPDARRCGVCGSSCDSA